MGPLGPLGPLGLRYKGAWAPWGPWGPNPPWLGVSIFKKIPTIEMLAFVGPKMVKKKVEIEGAGPP